MNPSVDAQTVRRWQEEVARDPASTAFVPLAEVYRREGRLEVARRLCVRGLERQPELVDAHLLLGRIYRESGELERACDELDIALRLDPDHRAARRTLGYLFLERREWEHAVRHLDTAAAGDPHDPRLASALALARRHSAARASAAAPAPEELMAAALQRFVLDVRVRLVLVMAGSGRIVARAGSGTGIDLAALASLAAGIHSASREMARMLGQPGFGQLFQGEGERQVFFGCVGSPAGEMIVVALFGSETTVGLVRVSFEDLARELVELPVQLGTRTDAAGFEADLAAGLRGDRADGGAAGRDAVPLLR